jgi:hypothetical protein
MPVAAAAMAGNMLGSVGQPNPEMDRMQKMQEVKNEVDSSGLDLATAPDEFYEFTAQTLQKHGLIAEAKQVYDQALAEKSAKAKDKLAQDELEFKRKELTFKEDDLRRKNPAPAMEIAGKGQELTKKLLEQGTEPEEIAKILESSKTGDPEFDATIDNLITSLPSTQEEYLASQGEAEVSKAKAAIRTLVASGWDEREATGLVLGKEGSSIKEDVGALDVVQRRAISQRILSNTSLAKQLEKAIPLMNTKTVGWLAGVSEYGGGFLNQVPGLRALVNVIDSPLSEDSADSAKQARAKFRALIGPLARYILQQEGKISNQAIEFAQKADAILDVTTDADNAKAITAGILAGVREAIAVDNTILQNEGIYQKPSKPEAGPAVRIIELDDGMLGAVDEDGNIVHKFDIGAPQK